MAGASTWRQDDELREDLEKYILQGIQRKEILDFMYRDYPHYTWSMRSLDRRLRHFEIYYVDKSITVQEVRNAVQEELNRPGCQLGYRAMRQKYLLKVPRDRIYDVMYDLGPGQLEERRLGVKNKKKRGNFISRGSNWVLSLDGHDKLMGYQNWTFPLAIYGCTDTASRKLLWLRIWDSNSRPDLVERWFLEFLYESRVVPAYIRVDKGSETGTIATMVAFLRRNCQDLDDPTDSVIYGPSTSNQVLFCA